jgi:hypothetical protein
MSLIKNEKLLRIQWRTLPMQSMKACNLKVTKRIICDVYHITTCLKTYPRSFTIQFYFYGKLLQIKYSGVLKTDVISILCRP